MKIAIVDDNITERERLSGYVHNWAKNSSEIELFDSGESFLLSIRDKSFDIVFMDIIMDGKNGIDAAKALRKITLETVLIFITSSPEYMVQAFPCHAFDYVIKPYTEQRIAEVLGEVQRAVGTQRETVEIGGEKYLLDDILYAYSDSNYCEIHTRHDLHRVRISFTELSSILVKYPAFMVVNRGTIINFDNTSHISGLNCIIMNGDRVPISRRKLKEVEKAFLDRQFSKLLEEGK